MLALLLHDIGDYLYLISIFKCPLEGWERFVATALAGTHVFHAIRHLAFGREGKGAKLSVLPV